MTKVKVEFKVKKKDVIELLEKRKNGFPWGHCPNEKYKCLIFWENGVIFMTVNEFHEINSEAYECLRPYTVSIGGTLTDYEKLTEADIEIIAYNAWCTGAR